MKSVAALALSFATIALSAAAQPPAPTVAIPAPGPAQDTIAIGTPLVIDGVGSAARAVVSPEAVAAKLVAGTWEAPKPGDEVQLPNGQTRAWREAVLEPSGLLKRDGDGYALVPIEATADEIGIAQIIGHGMVWVNGEPRAGDVYGTGWARLPILLRKGRNELLIRTLRGREVRVRLQRPISQVFIDPIETTLPDLIEGQPGRMLAGLIVVNATDQWQREWYLTGQIQGAERIVTALDPLPPLSTRKVGFEFAAPAAVAGGKARLDARLVRTPEPGALAPFSATVLLDVRTPEQRRKITFRSGIDGSVQYYALQPAAPPAGARAEALILTLHGAGVEGSGQADAYRPSPWANIVAPTNRRPYGFDWEDWGRLDAMEVLDLAMADLKPDPARVYLTGHSMGGHGTWQIGAHLAPRFAAIAPSAGWVSFRSYAGAAAYEGGSPVERVLRRAASPSDTLALKENYRGLGVYVLHGDADDNVPVEQARTMRGVLGEFHPDFAYYERPGAGHWWGNECVDWPPLMEFLRAHQRRPSAAVRFATVCPGISSQCDWATIEQQVRQLEPSTIELRAAVQRPEPGAGEKAAVTLTGMTSNVAAIGLDLAAIARVGPADGATPPASLSVRLDDQPAFDVPAPGPRLRLVREEDTWRVAGSPAAGSKGPRRSGLFKSAFTNRVLLVVGTSGTPEENAWSVAQARYDAETFWYRGNGSLPIVLDREFDPRADPDRNVVLYGNADTNRAWGALLGDSPIQVARGRIAAGERSLGGEDLACLMIRPRPGSETASVGAISGSGLAGMRLTTQVPYFRSGVGLPDWIVVGPEALSRGVEGVRGAGFFGNDWSLPEADSGWLEGVGP